MRFAIAVIATFTALAGLSPAAHAERAVLSIESPRSMLHFAPQRCAWSAEGLPAANEQWRPLLVFGCFGGAENRFLLRDGVLLAADGQSQIAPAPVPTEPQCYAGPRGSRLRGYHIGVCLDPGAPAAQADFSVLPDEAFAMRLIAVYPSLPSEPVAGHPVYVSRIFEDRPARAHWEYLPEQRRLRLRGTDLCLTAPPRDLTDGAPLYLDTCGAPHDAADDPQAELRQRIVFSAR